MRWIVILAFWENARRKGQLVYYPQMTNVINIMNDHQQNKDHEKDIRKQKTEKNKLSRILTSFN